MKLGIMQPYVFPYIGYFQLINAVDQFVIHDDVQWIKGGWINRNRIFVQGKAHYITFPVKKDSCLLNINQRALSDDIEQHKKKIIQQLEGVYRKAPYFDSVMKVIYDCFACQERNISMFIVYSLQVCCTYLGIQTPFIFSSALNKCNDLHGEDRVLEINFVMGANHYINPIGGMELYDKKQFADNGIQLSFIKARNIAYKQLGNHAFIPFLSIIDVMMFNSLDEIMTLLEEYDLY